MLQDDPLHRRPDGHHLLEMLVGVQRSGKRCEGQNERGLPPIDGDQVSQGMIREAVELLQIFSK